MFCSILQGTKFGQKLNNQTNLRVAHLVTVNGRRTCNMSNVSIILVHPVQGATKKWTSKVFRCFLSNRLKFLYEILQLHLVKHTLSSKV